VVCVIHLELRKEGVDLLRFCFCGVVLPQNEHGVRVFLEPRLETERDKVGIGQARGAACGATVVSDGLAFC
jgi:hypothetical protein